MKCPGRARLTCRAPTRLDTSWPCRERTLGYRAVNVIGYLWIPIFSAGRAAFSAVRGALPSPRFPDPRGRGRDQGRNGSPEGGGAPYRYGRSRGNPSPQSAPPPPRCSLGGVQRAVRPYGLRTGDVLRPTDVRARRGCAPHRLTPTHSGSEKGEVRRKTHQRSVCPTACATSTVYSRTMTRGQWPQRSLAQLPKRPRDSYARFHPTCTEALLGRRSICAWAWSRGRLPARHASPGGVAEQTPTGYARPRGP
jgi:hypothetical protein